MFDRREAILVQMYTLLQELAGIVSVWRDRAELQEFNQETSPPTPILPAAVLLDGMEKEVPRVATPGHGIRPGPQPPTLMCLYPQVFIAPMPRDTVQNVGIGPEVSAWRMDTLKLILKDVTLQNLLGSNGNIQYLGCDTDLQEGQAMVGLLLLKFAVTYVFDPNDL